MLIALELRIISTFVPFIFYRTVLKYVDAGKAAVMAFVKPMVAAIAGIMLFEEALH